MLRYLVSSSAIGYTNRVFAVAAVLKRRYFLSHPLIQLQKALSGSDHKSQKMSKDRLIKASMATTKIFCV